MTANARAHAHLRPSRVIATYFDIFGPILPADAHARATRRLYVSIKKLPLFRRHVISDYPTFDDLLDTIAASIAIPGITVGLAHKSRRHGWCLDGGPEVPDDDRPGHPTLRVGVGPRMPLTRPDHVTPSRPVGFALRFRVAPEPERRALFHLGYADARRYLERT